MKADDVPGPAQLTAHVRTAADAAIRWLDRALNSDPADLDEWDQLGFNARMILMRGLERGELIGFALDREAAQGAEPDRRLVLRTGLAYWGEARQDLDGALRDLRRMAGESPTLSRAVVMSARERIADASSWLEQLADGLARTEVLDRQQEPRAPSVDDGLDLEVG